MVGMKSKTISVLSFVFVFALLGFTSATTLFSDNFNDGIVLDDGWSAIYDMESTPALPDIDIGVYTQPTAYEGEFSAYVRNNALVYHSVDTTGYENIVLDYCRRTYSMEDSDKFKIGWKYGSSSNAWGDWNEVESMSNDNWECVSQTLDSSADNKNILIAFHLYNIGSRDLSTGKLDLVKVSGTPICPPALDCGNGDLETDEECDDGNTNDDDGCSATCTIEHCGDWIRQDHEQCDDGNVVNGDGCSSNCIVEKEPDCGNSILETGEQCDLGNLNGVLCWAGYGSSCTYCTSICKLKTITNYCGDGIKQECEECDDGNSIDDDSCSNECEINPLPPICDHDIAVRYTYSDTFNSGIGISENSVWLDNPIILEKNKAHSVKYRIDNNKEADDNVHITLKIDGINLIPEYDKLINEYHSKTFDLDISNLQCNSYHTISLEIESDGEECNLNDNHASREFYINCGIEPPIPPVCGDSVCNGAETCSSCSADCGICPPTPVCGNCIIETGEECDDGNSANGDGCSSSCVIEENEEEDDNENFNSNNFVQFCTSSWVCSGWSECSDGFMTRSCIDENNCDIEYNKPYEQTDCKDLSKVYVEKVDSSKFWIILGIILFIVLLIILINIL